MAIQIMIKHLNLIYQFRLYQVQQAYIYIVFSYELKMLNILNNIYIGSIGGGLSLNISGQGFSSNITVKICNQVCNLTDSSLTLLTCLVFEIY